jgi:hypothetical protein
MKVIDPGHRYEVDVYDKGPHDIIYEDIRFMKREGDGYPFNKGHYPGTNCQDVIRVLIDRVQYLQKQIECNENDRIIYYLRQALVKFEIRAARRHGISTLLSEGAVKLLDKPELIPVCKVCGHFLDIVCKGHI